MQFRTLIGLQFEQMAKSPAFGTGVIIDCFQRSGTLASRMLRFAVYENRNSGGKHPGTTLRSSESLTKCRKPSGASEFVLGVLFCENVRPCSKSAPETLEYSKHYFSFFIVFFSLVSKGSNAFCVVSQLSSKVSVKSNCEVF